MTGRKENIGITFSYVSRSINFALSFLVELCFMTMLRQMRHHIIPVLQIKRDNLGIIFRITLLKETVLMKGHNICFSLRHILRINLISFEI